MPKQKRSDAPRSPAGPETLDDTVASAPGLPFAIVGVGASAGGLEAFTRLLRALPGDTGMAFVLVQHLAPAHESALAEILARATTMPVNEVVNERDIAPNHVYVIPPDRSLAIAGGRLRLFLREEHGMQHPIDVFFHSLAREQRELAVGVVLSGTATDGTVGLEEIKSAGGITFAQDASAQYEGMPRSAVGSGCVDFTLSPEGIAAELARIAAHPYVARPSAEDAKTAALPDKPALGPILELLREVMDIDFTLYKTSTLARRVSRRMVLGKVEGLDAYEKLLRENPAEVDALYRDILINVTSFFRDPEMFEALRTRVIPALLDGRSRQDPIRAWVLGCSTGEEAYSLAIVFAEAMESASGHPPAQIFATDLNARHVEHARAGVYSQPRVQGVSPARLRRFFTEGAGEYRVTKPIRDMCVFARQNVLADPPFSRMDLISCRNLLIYLEPVLQQKIMPVLLYALKPDGHLILGSSESVGAYRDAFTIEDAKHKLFRKKPGLARPLLGVPVPRSPAGADPAATRRVRSGGSRVTLAAAEGAPEVYREADRTLLSRFAPPGVLVNADLEILQFRGNTEAYLAPAPGKASLSLLKMAREDLQVPLLALVERARKELVPVRDEGLRIRSHGVYRPLDLEVVPVGGHAGSEPAFLVLFEEPGVRAGSTGRAAKGAGGSRPGAASGREADRENLARLEHDLASTRAYLQSLVEQQDAANEELQAANEEAQSANEELQSINEELETSKEEIQSSNEELTTVNDELHNRILESGRLNSDLANLVNSIQTAIVIVGRDLRIRRYSPMAEKLLNVIPSDVGRPFTDIRTNFTLPELDTLLAGAIETAGVQERELQDHRGHWYSLRIRPYLTAANEVDGAVLMLMDIDHLKRAEQGIAAARDYAEAIVRTVRDPLLILDATLRVRTANPSFYETFGVGAAETEGRPIFELGQGHWDVPALRERLESVLPGKSSFDDLEVSLKFEGIGRRTMLVSAHALGVAGGHPPGILVGIRDHTEFLRFQAALRRSELRYRRLFEAAKDGVLIVDPETRRILDANPFMTELLGYAHEELLGKELFEIGLLKDEEASREAFRELQACGFMRYEDLPLETKTGERREVELVSNLYREAEDAIIQCNVRDITERKRTELAVRRSEQELARRVEELAAIDIAKGQFLAVLAHELRSPLNAIRGWLQILQRPGRSEADLGKGLDVIDRNSKAQIDLISDLLDAHRIGAGKASLQLRNLDLREAIDAALATAEPAAAQRHIRIVREDDREPALVSADPGRLQQVLGNVLANALKFTPANGEIRVVLSRSEGLARVDVTDSGEGITPEALVHIFEPFRQAESDANRGHAGLGLGLSIASQIVQLHGGTIDAKSPGKGKGATFTITLPLLGANGPARQAVAVQRAHELLTDLRGLLVLVVDDNPDAREPVRRVLEDAGAEVVAVASAEEALEAVRQQRPDVIVSDIAMPGRDGYELMRSVRMLPPGRGGQVPAIALTAYAAAEDRERALDAGFRTHLAKPVDPAVLVAEVAALAAPMRGPAPETER